MSDLFAPRRTRLRRELKRIGAEAALITHPINVRYLSGFTGDSSFLLLDGRRTILISDTRFQTQIEQECAGLEVEIRDASTTTNQLAARVIQQLKPRSLAVEADAITKAEFDDLARCLVGTSLVESRGLVQKLRAIKDKSEIKAIRRSIGVAEKAFRTVCSSLAADQTEHSVAAELEFRIRQLGGDGCSFPPIVGVGARGALPHGRPGSTRLGESSFVLIDWGAMVCGYASDLTRVLSTGKISAKFKRVYEVVRRAQQAAVRRIRPGKPLADVDRAARTVIADSGYGKYFGHGLGHGFGLEIHELPRLSPLGTGPLEAGMVVTVEPGIYLPDWGGIRIEDDFLVTPDGCERLTTLSPEWEENQVELS